MKTYKDDGYDWTEGDWGECDAVCGGGFRTRQTWCSLRSTQERVPDYLCSEATRPPTNETCNTQPCRVCEIESYTRQKINMFHINNFFSRHGSPVSGPTAAAPTPHPLRRRKKGERKGRRKRRREEETGHAQQYR